MIEIKNVTKKFGDIVAVNQVNLTIQEGNVFGLLGTNGAGKSTLLRMLAGIYVANSGEVKIDGHPVWNNAAILSNLFYISDEQFYFQNESPREIGKFYMKYYPKFDEQEYLEYLERFGLDSERKVKTFSKGMKKQLSILLGVCANVKYLFCDETFDGLDPVMRQGIKSIFAKEIDERGLTPIIASHNLRELEDICDCIGLLHKGGVILSKDLIELKGNFIRIQCVLSEEYDEELKRNLSIVKWSRHGKLLTLTVRGKTDEAIALIEEKKPIYCEALPLSLEEIFISEMEVVGYDIKNLIC